MAAVWRVLSVRGGSTTHRRGRMAPTVVAVALAAALIFAANAGSAYASEEHCPNTATGTAVVEWGINGVEQLGAGFRSTFDSHPNTVLGLSNVRQADAGFKFALAVLANCTVDSWGANGQGELGNGNQLDQSHPVTVGGAHPLEEVKEVAIGNGHAMALLYNGTVWTWGTAEMGDRGNGEKGWERVAKTTEPERFKPRDEPIQVLSGVKQIASGGVRDYALLESGEVLAWGEDKNNELGVKQPAEEEHCYGETHAITPMLCSAYPRPVLTAEGAVLKGVERIGAGEEAAYAIMEGGKEMLAWGDNGKGQLGNESLTTAARPVKVHFEPSSRVTEVTGGDLYVLARLENGTVYAWGGDEGGSSASKPRAAKPTNRAGGIPATRFPSRCSRSATSPRSRPAKTTALRSKKKKAARTSSTPSGAAASMNCWAWAS